MDWKAVLKDVAQKKDTEVQSGEDGYKEQRLRGDPSKKICPLLFCVPITEHTAWVISKSGNYFREFQRPGSPR